MKARERVRIPPCLFFFNRMNFTTPRLTIGKIYGTIPRTTLLTNTKNTTLFRFTSGGVGTEVEDLGVDLALVVAVRDLLEKGWLLVATTTFLSLVCRTLERSARGPFPLVLGRPPGQRLLAALPNRTDSLQPELLSPPKARGAAGPTLFRP